MGILTGQHAREAGEIKVDGAPCVAARVRRSKLHGSVMQPTAGNPIGFGIWSSATRIDVQMPRRD